METGGQAAGHDVLRDQRHADKAHEAEEHETTTMTVMQVRRIQRDPPKPPGREICAQAALRASPEFVDHGCGTMSLDLYAYASWEFGKLN